MKITRITDITKITERFKGGGNLPPFKADLFLDLFKRDTGSLVLQDKVDGNDAAAVGVEMADFNGTTSKLIISPDDIVGTGDVTLMGWFNARTLGGSSTARIFDNTKFNILLFNTKIAAVSDGATIATSDLISLNKIQFFAITRSSIGVTNFYVGDETNSPTISGTLNQSSGTPAAGGKSTIGSRVSTGRVFDGLLGGIIAVNGLLPLSEIVDYYNGVLPDNIIFNYGLNGHTYESKLNSYAIPTDITYISTTDKQGILKSALDNGYYGIKDATEIDLYILMGQSNMTGWDNAVTDEKYSDSYYSYDYEAGVDIDTNIYRFNTYWGVEISMSERLKLRTGRPSAFVKVSEGSTGFGDGEWIQGGRLYNRLITAYNTFINTLAAKGVTVKLNTIISILGEEDSKDLTWANNYYDNYMSFLSDIQSDLGISAEVIMTRLHDDLPGGYQYSPIVRAQQDSLGLEDDITLVLTDDISLKVDEVHFNGDGLVDLGIRIANSVQVDNNISSETSVSDFQIIAPEFTIPINAVSYTGGKLHNLINSYICLNPTGSLDAKYDILDRINQTSASTDSVYYDSTDRITRSTYHISEMNQYTLSTYFNVGDKGKVFNFFDTNSIDDRNFAKEFLVYMTDKTNEDEIKVLKYTGDIAKAIDDGAGSYVVDGDGYVVLTN